MTSAAHDRPFPSFCSAFLNLLAWREAAFLTIKPVNDSPRPHLQPKSQFLELAGFPGIQVTRWVTRGGSGFWFTAELWKQIYWDRTQCLELKFKPSHILSSELDEVVTVGESLVHPHVFASPHICLPICSDMPMDHPFPPASLSAHLLCSFMCIHSDLETSPRSGVCYWKTFLGPHCHSCETDSNRTSHGIVVRLEIIVLIKMGIWNCYYGYTPSTHHIVSQLTVIPKCWMSAVLKVCLYCMLPSIWHSGKGKTIDTIKDQWLPGLVEGWGCGGWTGRALRVFRTVELLCRTFSDGYICPNP